MDRSASVDPYISPWGKHGSHDLPRMGYTWRALYRAFSRGYEGVAFGCAMPATLRMVGAMSMTVPKARFMPRADHWG